MKSSFSVKLNFSEEEQWPQRLQSGQMRLVVVTVCLQERNERIPLFYYFAILTCIEEFLSESPGATVIDAACLISSSTYFEARVQNGRLRDRQSLMLLHGERYEFSAAAPVPCLPDCYHVPCQDGHGLTFETTRQLILSQRDSEELDVLSFRTDVWSKAR
ncbi:hypothetical protein STEG23_028622, partial [Scotinomys teguina]